MLGLDADGIAIAVRALLGAKIQTGKTFQHRGTENTERKNKLL
jgi:hypothetical protein